MERRPLTLPAVASCGNCGSSITGPERYCPTCGAEIDQPAHLFDDPVETGAATVRDERRWPVALGALAAAGLLVWLLTRPSDSPGQVEQTFEEDSESESTTTQPRTTTGPTTTVMPFVVVEGGEPGEPLLGEPVGWTLFVGGVTARAIDLDTGALLEIAVDGAPLLATDQWLVVADTDGGVSVVSRTDPAAIPRPLTESELADTAFPDGPDHVWVLDSFDGADTARWTSVALSDGTTRTALEPTSFWGPAIGPRVGGTASGGVYVLNDDRSSYRRLADGNPLTATEDAVIVELCTSPAAATCRTYWIDLATGREIDRFVPPPKGAWWLITSSPTGAFVSTESDDGVTLWDTRRGSEIATGLAGDNGGLVAGYSPDDRFVAFSGATSDQIVVYDSVSGESRVITTPDRRIRPYGLAFGPTAGE